MQADSQRATGSIDRQDVAAGLCIGLVSGMVKLLQFRAPAWEVGFTSANIPFMLCLVYILYRGRREPHKLDEWGLTTRITPMAWLVFVLFMVIAIASLAAMAWAVGGPISFERPYVFRMIDYIIAAFPQQFFLCSVGLATLAKWPPLHGNWRLPLAVGLLFGLAHFWSPTHIPGTGIPIQMLITMPLGFAASYYFLRFRTILPLTAAHAILYVLLVKWVEHYL